MNIIAYGSLMNRASLEATLGRRASLNKIVVPGVRRIFNAPFDGYAFLNLESTPGSSIEAAWFALDKSELSRFDVREAGSILAEVMPGYFTFIWPPQAIQNLPVLQSYLDFCQAGATRLQVNFRLGLGRPAQIIDDLRQPLYPPNY